MKRLLCWLGFHDEVRQVREKKVELGEDHLWILTAVVYQCQRCRRVRVSDEEPGSATCQTGRKCVTHILPLGGGDLLEIP